METCWTWHDAFLKDCPSRGILAMVSGKWTLLAFCALGAGPMRFGELRRRLQGVSQKMLTETLRDLEGAGLAGRFSPPHRPGSSTPSPKLGHSLGEPFSAIKQWSDAHIAEISANRREYDQRAARPPAALPR